MADSYEAYMYDNGERIKTDFEITDCLYGINQSIMKIQKIIEEDILMLDEGEYQGYRDALLMLTGKRDALRWALGKIEKI